MTYSPKYTTDQRVRYMSALLTTDDMSDAEILQFIEQAETEIEGWASRAGVDITTWSPIVPDGVVHTCTYKACEHASARKLYDARIATSESRAGSSYTIQAEERIKWFQEEAKKAWDNYLATLSLSPKTRVFSVGPAIAYFDEEKWRAEGEEV